MSILYKTTRFADTFTGDKDTNIRVQLLSWDTLDTKAFVEYLAFRNNITKGDAYKNLSMVLEGIEAILKDGTFSIWMTSAVSLLTAVSARTKNPVKTIGQNP